MVRDLLNALDICGARKCNILTEGQREIQAARVYALLPLYTALQTDHDNENIKQMLNKYNLLYTIKAI